MRRRHLEREAKAISRLNHPHICTLYDIGHHEAIDYLVMEFLAGETVREQLDRDFFSIQDVVRHGHAHRRGAGGRCTGTPPAWSGCEIEHPREAIAVAAGMAVSGT